MADTDLNRNMSGSGGNTFPILGKARRAWSGDLPPAASSAPSFAQQEQGPPCWPGLWVRCGHSPAPSLGADKGEGVHGGTLLGQGLCSAPGARDPFPCALLLFSREAGAQIRGLRAMFHTLFPILCLCSVSNFWSQGGWKSFQPPLCGLTWGILGALCATWAENGKMGALGETT